MKKGLMICLLVISSLGVGVLGTNIYYNNLPKPQIKQQTATNKEIEKEDTVEDKKEIVTNEDEETWHCQYCGVKLNANNQYGEIDMCNYCHYLYCEKPYENKTYEDSVGFSE